MNESFSSIELEQLSDQQAASEGGKLWGDTLSHSSRRGRSQPE
jgi:hypothetical protein